MNKPISRIVPFKPKRVFVCDCCQEQHDELEEAALCCKTIAEEFVCPVCNERHDNESLALSCCNYDPSTPPPPKSWELELEGQMRLEGVA